MQPIKILVFIVLVGNISASYARQFPAFNPDVSTWIENPPPLNTKSFEWHNWRYGARHSSLIWDVRMIDGKVIAQMKTSPYKYDDSLPSYEISVPLQYEKISRSFGVSDGWFIAFNNSKAGSQLWWYGHDGHSRYHVTSAYVTSLIEKGRDIYIFDAYYFNRSPAEGSLQKIIKDESGIWRVDKVVALETYPSAVQLRKNGDFLVVGNPSVLFFIDEKFERIDLLGMEDWYVTFPRSIVSTLNDKFVYVGSTQYVIEVNLETKQVRYLVPSEEFIEHKIDESNRSLFQQDK